MPKGARSNTVQAPRRGRAGPVEPSPGRRRWWPAAALLAPAMVGFAVVAWRVLGPAAPDLMRAGVQNVLLISIDTLRADALSAVGGRAATPTSAQAHNGLGAVERQPGKRQDAIAHFEAAVERDPRNYDALFNAGSELADDGQFEAARPYLERFAASAPPAFYARDIQRVRERLARLSR